MKLLEELYHTSSGPRIASPAFEFADNSLRPSVQTRAPLDSKNQPKPNMTPCLLPIGPESPKRTKDRTIRGQVLAGHDSGKEGGTAQSFEHRACQDAIGVLGAERTCECRRIYSGTRRGNLGVKNHALVARLPFKLKGRLRRFEVT